MGLVDGVGELVILLFLATGVFLVHEAPDAVGALAGISVDEIVGHHPRVDGEIGKRRHEDGVAQVNCRAFLFDSGVDAQVALLRLGAFRIVRSHVVLGQACPDAVEPLLDRLLVVGCAVHEQ